MGLILVVWGGSIYDDDTAGGIIEVWSNSVAVQTVGPPDSSQFLSLTSSVGGYWSNEKTTIAPQVALEFIKANAYDVTTGRQITDPTYETFYSPGVRGTGTITNPRPITTARRVTIDDGTRNRRHKGGWFSPVVLSTIEDSFRWSTTSRDSACDRAHDFLADINSISGCRAAVWSRTGHTTTPVTRVRVGDVPDNISRRKNNMREVYHQRSI